MNSWYLGWDPSRNGFHAMVLVNQQKDILAEATVNGLEAASSQVRHFQDRANSEGFDLHVGVESSEAIIPQFLIKQGFDPNKLYELIPRKVSAYKQASDVGSDKSDLLDAYACACYLMDWLFKLKPYQEPSILEQKAFKIAQELDWIRSRKTEAWERFWSEVDRSNPEIKRLLKNKEVTWFLAIFSEMLGKMKHTSYSAFERFCRKKGSRSTEEVLKPLHQSLVMLETWADIDILAFRAREIQLCMQEAKNFENKACEVLNGWKAGLILLTIDGMGPATLIRLLAYLGADWSQHTSKGICKYAGLAPQLCSSGAPDEKSLLAMSKKKRSRYKTHFIHRLGCNKDLKTAICLFTKFSMKHNNWVLKTYYKKKERGQGHWENIRNLSMKWVHIFVAMIRNQTEYNSELHKDRTLVKT